MISIEPKKRFHDSIHGLIQVSNIAIRIVNTHEFQRLRFLHQLGTSFLVFPTATHSRFEHSLGTYFLAGKLLESIKRDTDNKEINDSLDSVDELKSYFDRTYKDTVVCKLDTYVCELIKIAGLCHDLGHGPFSHIFDDLLIPLLRSGEEHRPCDEHETRSCIILERIIKKDPYLSEIIKDPEIQFMKDLINPKPNMRGFVYQIISNNFNSIDVDKYDYMARDSYTLGLCFGFNYNRLVGDVRVINNIICYPEQISYEVVSIFQTRYRLHKQVYAHKVVIATQLMICDIMTYLDPIMKIYESVSDIDKFCQLTDDYILSAVKYLYKEKQKYNADEIVRIDKAYTLYQRLLTRDLYQFVTTVVSEKELDYNIFDVLGINDNPDAILNVCKIGFVSGLKKNPIESLYFYKSKCPTDCHTLQKEQISCLLSNRYQECLNMIFLRHKNDVLKEAICSKLQDNC
jgi:deoxynucleoside triphosphate triphosphohydrolase SAMHD1